MMLCSACPRSIDWSLGSKSLRLLHVPGVFYAGSSTTCMHRSLGGTPFDVIVIGLGVALSTVLE